MRFWERESDSAYFTIKVKDKILEYKLEYIYLLVGKAIRMSINGIGRRGMIKEWGCT